MFLENEWVKIVLKLINKSLVFAVVDMDDNYL